MPSVSLSVPLVLVTTRIGLALLLGTHLSLLGSYLSYSHGQRFTSFSVILLFPPYCSGSVQLDAPFAINFSIFMAAATTTASYSFTDEEVSRLAKCDDQPEFLLLYRRILQLKGIDPTAVFDAKTTLGSHIK